MMNMMRVCVRTQIRTMSTLSVEEVLSSRLGMKSSDIANTMSSRPVLSKEGAGEAVSSRVDYLLDELEVPVSKARALVAGNGAPLLGYELEKTVKPKVEWLKSELSFSGADVGVIVSRFPLVLGYSLEARLKPRVEELEARGLSREVIARMIRAYPQLFSMPSPVVAAKLAFLHDVLGLDTDQQVRVLATNPNVMGRSIDDHLAVWVQFCTAPAELGPDNGLVGLGMTIAGLRRLVVHFPHSLGYSVAGNLVPTMQHFVDVWGVPPESLARILTLYPRTLGLSVPANLGPKAAFFSQALSLEKPDLAAFLLDFPPILGYSLDSNIRPKLAALSSFIEESLPSLPADHPLAGIPLSTRDTILASPRLFSYSHTRIATRLALLKDPKVVAAKVFGDPSNLVMGEGGTALRLGAVLILTDDKLDSRLHGLQHQQQ